VQLRTRLYHRALTSGIVDPIAAEEEALAIVAALAGTRAPDLNSAQQVVVERAKAFLGQHFREPVSLGDVARAAGASPFSVSRAFPVVTGTTLHRYIVSLRLASTLDAIAAGADDLSRVAVDAGFAHHSHFTKTFARAFGATPQAIRRRLNLFSLRP
jgi:AraC-like DNA-binding protein